MAIIRRCDKCGALEVEAKITIYRKRKFHNQYDGDYETMESVEFDVCEKCARGIELNFVSVKEADETIFV